MDKYYWKNGGSRSAVLGLEEERRSAYQSSDGRRQREKNCPSFSSSLLDQIYRSMDGEDDEEDDALVLYTETAGRKPIKKHYYNYPTTPSTTTSPSWKKKQQLQDDAVGNYNSRLGRIEKWMEKKKAITSGTTTNQNKIILLNHHHNSTAAAAAAAAEYYPRRKSAAENGDQCSSSCCRSSSDSSSGDYLFSSSEAESTSKTTTSSSSYTKYTPNPIRTGVHRFSSSTCTTNHDQQPHEKHKQTTSIAAGTSKFRNHEMKRSDEKHQQGSSSSTKTNNSGDHFSKTKSKALKIYADLKKVKQPLSPGVKLASFFTSLFNNNNNNAKKVKKAKMVLVSSNEEEEVISKSKYWTHHRASTCSRTTSCLSKTSTSTHHPPTTSTCKRSVRFYPLTTVIVDGKDCLQTTTTSQRDKRNNDSGIREIMNWRGEEVARDLFKSSHHKRSAEFKNTIVDINDHEEDDDAASCASSDLFELDNLNSHHAFERYGEELPVYETTYFDTNRPIADGLFM